MRQKRAKSYRKQMLVYNHTFKFREPYQVLVDDQLVLDCCSSSFDLVKGLQRTLQAEVKVMITQCCMQALYLTKNQEAIEIAKGFERRRCNHPPKDPLSPLECLSDVVNVKGANKHRYVVASQNIEIRRLLRKLPGVPLIHLSRSVMIMEPLSDASSKVSEKVEGAKLLKGLNDPSSGRVDTSPTSETSSTKPNPQKRKKGPKGPNPLSMKKKKVKTDDGNKNKDSKEENTVDDSQDKTKRRRRRNKNGLKSNEKADSEQSGKELSDDLV